MSNKESNPYAYRIPRLREEYLMVEGQAELWDFLVGVGMPGWQAFDFCNEYAKWTEHQHEILKRNISQEEYTAACARRKKVDENSKFIQLL